MLRKLLIRLSAAALSLVCFMNLNVLAQEYYDAVNSPRQYYYNNLESATAATPSTFFPNGASTRSASAAIVLTSGSSLNGTKSFSTAGSSTLGYISWNFLANSTTGANTSLNSAAWEWEFDYKNTTGGTTYDPDNNGAMIAGQDSWRYWLIANTYQTNTTTLGLYVTQSGGNLVVRYKYGTATNQYQNYLTMSMPNNTDTYQIRAIRSVTGYWNFYILDRTTGVTTSSLNNNINIGALNTYNLSHLEATSAAANRFQFDNFNFYQARLDYIPISPTVNNGMTTVIYPGIVNAIPYAVNVNVRGDITIGRFVINFTGNAGNVGQSLFSTGAFYKTATNVFSVSTGTKLGNNVGVNGSNTQQTDFSQLSPPEYYYSAGNTDGTTANVVNYFFVAQGQNPFYNGYPTTISYSVSTSVNDNYSQFFNNTAPYGTSSSSSVSAPGANGDLWDWTGAGADASWITSGNWTKNSAASTANPNSSSDIARIGIVAYTGSARQPTLSNNRSISKLLFGSNNTPTLTLDNSTTLTLASGIELQNNTTATITGGNNASTLTVSGGVSSIPSGSSLTVDNDGGFFNSSAVTIAGSLIISRDFTNTSTGTFTATAGTVTFDRNGNQTISNANTAKTVTFYNLNVSSINGSRVKTLTNGKFAIAAGGLVTLSGARTALAIDSATNALLTLKSSATGTASVDVIPTNNSITGRVAAERYVSGGTAAYRGYRLFSSPVYEGTTVNGNVYGVAYTKNSAYLTGTTGTGGGFDATSSTPTIYLYREDKASSSSATGGNFRGVKKINNSPTYDLGIDNETTNFNLPVGNGFMFFFRGNRATNASTSTSVIPDAVTFSNTGKLNQGDIDVKLWYTPASTTLGKVNTRYHLVGNPYASTIDWNKFSSTSSSNAIYGPNLSNTIYIYNAASKKYATYDGTNATNGGTRYIPSGQGFFVLADVNGTASLKFTEAAKEAAQQVVTPNLLMAKTKVVENIIPQYLQLQLKKDDIDKEDMVLRLNKDATADYKFKEDSPYFPGSGAVSLYSISADNVNLAINQIPLSLKSQTVRLYAGVNATGVYELAVTAIKDIPDMYDIWLKDAFTKDSVNLRSNPTYSFNANIGDATTFGANRFTLVIRLNAANSYHLLSFKATKAKNNVTLAWTTENEKDKTFFTLERSTNGGNSFEIIRSIKSSDIANYSIQDKTPATGENRYRLKQEDFTGTISYSETLTVMFTPGGDKPAETVVVYPNPVSAAINISVVQNSGTEAANYTITISNSSGLVVKTINSSQPEWQGNVGDLLPGSYFVKVKNAATKKTVGNATFIKF